MKIIFLDFGGVLLPYPMKPDADPLCVKALNRITDETGAGIVVTSSLRCDGLPRVRADLHRWGVTGEVVGCTPVLPPDGQRPTRLREIYAYLLDAADRAEFPSAEPLYIVVIDDERRQVDGLWNKLVCPDRKLGLTQADAWRAIGILERTFTVPAEERPW